MRNMRNVAALGLLAVMVLAIGCTAQPTQSAPQTQNQAVPQAPPTTQAPSSGLTKQIALDTIEMTWPTLKETAASLPPGVTPTGDAGRKGLIGKVTTADFVDNWFAYRFKGDPTYANITDDVKSSWAIQALQAQETRTYEAEPTVNGDTLVYASTGVGVPQDNLIFKQVDGVWLIDNIQVVSE